MIAHSPQRNELLEEARAARRERDVERVISSALRNHCATLHDENAHLYELLSQKT